MQDYRAQSYLKRAKAVAEEKGYTSPSENYINPSEPKKKKSSTIAAGPTSTYRVGEEEQVQPSGTGIQNTVSITPTSTYRTTTNEYVQMVKSGYKPSTNSAKSTVNPKIKTLFTGRTEPVPVSGPVAAKMARESLYPKTIRADTSYLLSVDKQQRGQYNLISPDREVQNDSTRSGNINNSGVSGSTLDGNKAIFKTQKGDGFQKRVEAVEERRRKFYSGQGWKNIEETASYLTFGKGKPLESRSFAGQSAQLVITPFLFPAIAPITIGENLAATGEGLIKNPRDTLKELGRGFKKVEQTSFSFLPGGTPINPEGVATLATTGIIAGISYPTFKNNPLTRFTLEKVYPNKFVSPESTGIKFVEAHTEPTSTQQLISLENTQAKTIHVTTSNPFKGKLFTQTNEFITTAKPTGAGKFRSENMLYNFYKSSPDPFTGQPRAYLGYAGILKEGSSMSGTKIIYGKPTIRFLTSNDFVSKTPSSLKNSGDLLAINRFQAKTSGTTFVPAENIVGASREGQLITPSSYKDISRAEQFGLKNTPGSVIKKTGGIKYTFYKKAPEPYGESIFIRGFQRMRNFADEITGRNYYKVELIETETKPVNDVAKYLKTSENGINAEIVDLGKYNESYGKIVYRSPKVISYTGSIIPSSTSFSGSGRSSSGSFSSKRSSGSSGSSSGSFGSTYSSGSSGGSSGSSFVGSSASSSLLSSSKVSSSSSGLSSSVASSSLPSLSTKSSLYSGDLKADRKFVSDIKRISFKKDSFGGSYRVDVRRFGKFKEVGKGLSFGNAERLGRGIAKSTAAATFRIRQGRRIVPLAGNGEFYSKGGLNIERNKFRINTGGELRGITYKGARKRRSVF